ncbi:MAG TPA: hypothetical protein DCE71_05950 [Parachlamydiales bacterium]|nr:hypothetical protein [Parachlamydiales bacterium]
MMATTVERRSFIPPLSEMTDIFQKIPSRARLIFCQFVGTKERIGKPKELRNYLIQKLNIFDQTVIDRVPTWIFQEAVDGFLKASSTKTEDIKKYIHMQLEKITYLQPFLKTDEGAHWTQQCAIFLGTLPFKIIANIFSLFLNILAGSIYATAHPLKALNELMKFIVDSIYKLTKAKTWSTMGAGVLGASFGQILVSGNPLSLMGILSGVAMITVGLTFGSLTAAITAEEGSRLSSVKGELQKQLSLGPKFFIEGFCMGLLLGGFQQLFKGTSPIDNHVRRGISMIPSNPKQKESISTTTQIPDAS